MKKYRLFVVLALIAVTMASCGKKAADSSQAPAAEKAPAKVNPWLVKRWALGLLDRHPGPDAKKDFVLGDSLLGFRATPNALAWFEMVDIDSNGTPEKVGFMWDGINKVVYAYTHDPVTLDDGTTAANGLVVAQFGEGNKMDRPMGSGFWAYATARDTVSYRQVEGSLYGCRFDAAGEETDCGPGTWSRENNNFTVSTRVK
jgi:hypothetical protein